MIVEELTQIAALGLCIDMRADRCIAMSLKSMRMCIVACGLDEGYHNHPVHVLYQIWHDNKGMKIFTGHRFFLLPIGALTQMPQSVTRKYFRALRWVDTSKIMDLVCDVKLWVLHVTTNMV